MSQCFCQFEILKQNKTKCLIQSGVPNLAGEPQNNKEPQREKIKVTLK